MISIKLALDTLKRAMLDDQAYANGWHDNISCIIMDELRKSLQGNAYIRANLIASQLMKYLFDVHTENPCHRSKNRDFDEFCRST